MSKDSGFIKMENGPPATVLSDRNLTIVRRIASDWQKLTPKRQTRKRYMKYEEMLMQEIPGASKKTNQAMHAVLESDLDDTEEERGRGMGATVKVRNHALIHYIAQLASSNNDNDTFDFSFVESLLKNGADINARDKHGQTIFHEVARSWHLDVAQFLLKNGARIDQQDKYGRAPLHVAAAVDYAKMVEFLINNGADVNIKTTGEEQSPIHFAAKNDACLSLKMLLAYGADMGARDYQERTPLQVSAEMSRSKAAKLLIDMGAPAGVYDVKGEVALSLLILKMPDVALVALDQFHSEDMINRKEYYFLNYLEGPRLLEDKKSGARTPLEVAIQTQQFDIVMHPVMQRLIYVKWKRFGKQGAWLDLATNLLFSVLWTILGVTLPHNADQLYEPLGERWWRLVLAILVMFLTFLEIFKQVASVYRVKKALTKWKGYREKELERDLPFCHPRWPEEKRYLDGEIKAVREERLLSSQDGWFYIDWFALILIIGSAVSHATFFFLDTTDVYNIHIRFVCMLLIVIWFRIMKYARPFKGPGPFVALFSHMLGDILKWVFLFLVFFIPYTACFWMIFGGYSKKPADDFETLPKLLYSVFGMTVLDNYNFDSLNNIDANMARILCGTYISICSIVILNLLIALLADTFTRVYENAIENAAMQRAKTILNLEQSLRKTHRKKYYDFIRETCSPEVKDYSQDDAGTDRDKKRQMDEMRLQVNDIFSLVNERFGKRFGEAQKSDLDELMDKISSVALETAKIRTSIQLTMIRLKALEQTVNENVPVSVKSASGSSSTLAFPRRPSSVSVKSTSSEKKSRDSREGKVKSAAPSESNTLKRAAKHGHGSREGKHGSPCGKSKPSSQRTHSRASLKSGDETRHAASRQSSRPPSRNDVLEEASTTVQELTRPGSVSATDDDALEKLQSSEQAGILLDQGSALSSEGESNMDDLEDESSSLTAELTDKNRRSASPTKKTRGQKQSSLTKMPKSLSDVFKKAKRKSSRRSSDSSQVSQMEVERGKARDEDRASATAKPDLAVYPELSEMAPLAPRSDLSDTSYVTTDN